MANLPLYLTDQTEAVIRQRILDALPAGYDKAEGSFLWDLVASLAIELAMGADWAQQVLERSFASTSFGAYLDLRAEEHGLTRKDATQATGTVRFTGTDGTVIPAGTQVSTPSSASSPAITFATNASVTIAGGFADAAVMAEQAGRQGNVAAGAISFLGAPVDGVTAVSNPNPTTGATDEESDADLLLRYYQRVRNPAAGGNKADYERWALEVPGVGGVSVVPVRGGPGTVSMAIIDTDRQPASQALVDAVQDHIAPPHTITRQTTALTIGGSGGAVDGSAVRLEYNAGGEATLTDPSLNNLLPQPGIWQTRLSVKVDNTAGATDLLEAGVWNVTTGAWAKTTGAGAVDARTILAADDLATDYAEVIQPFYWNGQDELELRVARKQTDTTTVVHLNQVIYRSTFSTVNGDGLAPIGAAVTVEAAEAVVINVSATLTIASGYDGATVRAGVEDAIEEYLRGLAFATDNDVAWVWVGNTIITTAGVVEYSDLLVNGGTAKIPVGPQQVAVKGTVTLS